MNRQTFCCEVEYSSGDRTDQYRHWCPIYVWQMEHVGTIHGSCDIAADLPLFLIVWKSFLPVFPSYEAAASMWFSFVFPFFCFWFSVFLNTSHMPSTVLVLLHIFCFNNVYSFQLKNLFYCHGNKNTEVRYTLLHRKKLKITKVWSKCPRFQISCSFHYTI